MKVFLDANILFSATNPRWLTRHLVDALAQKGAQLVTSSYVWEEAERNVRRYFPRHLQELGMLQVKLTMLDDPVVADGQFEGLPEKDRPVLAGAIYGNCSHLLTGDHKHFGALMGMTIKGVRIVSQRMLAEELTNH